MTIEKITDTLKKLYDKRSALDTQIKAAENSLMEAVKLTSKAADQIKAAGAKKPAKKAAVKKVLKK
jgi:hypothetical protein